MNGRRINDFYPTPTWATEILLRETMIGNQGDDRILEPCAGDGRISAVLQRQLLPVVTNDLDRGFDTMTHFDALDPDAWAFGWPEDFDWVISNPPFSLADELVPRAFRHARSGVAMLLRLSWLEPTRARGRFLDEHPPTSLIVLPRISFDGSGQTDNVTCAWFVWDKRNQGNLCQQIHQTITIVPRRAPQPALEVVP